MREAFELLNKVLDKLAKGIGSLSEKLQPVVHSGKIQEFWDWVDKKWYRNS